LEEAKDEEASNQSPPGNRFSNRVEERNEKRDPAKAKFIAAKNTRGANRPTGRRKIKGGNWEITREQRARYKKTAEDKFADPVLFGRNAEYKDDLRAGTKALGRFCDQETWKKANRCAKDKGQMIFKHATKEGIYSQQGIRSGIVFKALNITANQICKETDEDGREYMMMPVDLLSKLAKKRLKKEDYGKRPLRKCFGMDSNVRSLLSSTSGKASDPVLLKLGNDLSENNRGVLDKYARQKSQSGIPSSSDVNQYSTIIIRNPHAPRGAESFTFSSGATPPAFHLDEENIEIVKVYLKNFHGSVETLIPL